MFVLVCDESCRHSRQRGVAGTSLVLDTPAKCGSSYPPSMRALLHACRSLQSANLPEATQKVILYPDPPLPEGEREAALALLDRHAPKTTMLVTPQTLIANFG